MLKKSCMSLFVIVGLLLVDVACAMENQEEKSSAFDNLSIINVASSQDRKQTTKNNYQRPSGNEPRASCFSNCYPIKCSTGCDSDICGCAYARCQIGNRECKTYNPLAIGCISIMLLPGYLIKKCLCIECGSVE